MLHSSWSVWHLTLPPCPLKLVSVAPYLTSLSSSHTCVALKITEMLLSDCDPQRLQLIANSYLDMLHVMLESPHTDMQIMATDSVSRILLHTHLYHTPAPHTTCTLHTYTAPSHTHCSITHSTLHTITYSTLHTITHSPHSLHTQHMAHSLWCLRSGKKTGHHTTDSMTS